MIQPTISRLLRHIQELPVRLNAFSPEELAERPKPGKWSKKEILGHLIDSARYNLDRFLVAQMGEGPFETTSYKQAEQVTFNGYQSQPIGQIIILWQALNLQIIQVLSTFKEETLKRPIAKSWGSYGKEEPPKDLYFDFIIVDYVDHMEHHLRQLFGNEFANTPPYEGSFSLTEAEAAEALQAAAPSRFITLMQKSEMAVEWYEPKEVDLQQPHDQDEIYVVARGAGNFIRGEDTISFGKGDVLFVPAGMPHRFENFTDDFATWVFFFGMYYSVEME